MATRLSPAAYIEFWRTAAQEEFGLGIKVHPDDQAKLVNELYSAKQELGGGALDNLMLAQPNPPGTVFIVQKTSAEVL